MKRRRLARAGRLRLSPRRIHSKKPWSCTRQPPLARAPRFSTLSPLLDLEGLAASPPGAPKGLETLHLPAGGAPNTLEQPGATTWGSALMGGHGEPHGGAGGLSGGVSEGAQLPSAGAQMSTPPQQMAGGRAGEAGALAGGTDGLTPGSSMWARNVLASGGLGLCSH